MYFSKVAAVNFKLEPHQRNIRDDGGGRARARLSEYYGLDNGAGGLEAAATSRSSAGGTGLKKESLRSTMKKLTSVSGEPTSPYDINSADFDADMYGV